LLEFEHAFAHEGIALHDFACLLQRLRFQQRHRTGHVLAAPNVSNGAARVQRPYRFSLGLEERREVFIGECLRAPAYDREKLNPALLMVAK